MRTESPVRTLPRVMPLAQVARDILCLDPHEAYRLARDGKLAEAFKIGKCWYVSMPKMLRGMQTPQT